MMTRADKTSIAHWVLNWFQQRGAVPGETTAARLEVDYFQARLIESLQVIELIFDIEQEFGIQFQDSHFQDRRFSKIGGLSEIIAECMHGAEQ